MMVSAARDSRMAISTLCAPAEELPLLKLEVQTDGGKRRGGYERPASPARPVTPESGGDTTSAASSGSGSPPPSFNVSGLVHMPPTISASAAPIPPAAVGKRVVKRRMTNSERGKLYRSRRKSYMDTLTQQVQELQQEIATLETCGRMRHELVQALVRHGNGSPYWRVSLPTTPYSRVVCEYFAAFEVGLPSFLSPADGETLVMRRSPRQAVFVDTLVDEQLVFDGSVGAGHLIHCWESHTRAHASLRLKLERLDVMALEPRAIVQAAAELAVRFDRPHLAAMFPTLVDTDSGEASERVEKLLALEVSYPVRVHFYFGEDGKIVQYNAQVDLVGGWSRALGSVREAAELMEHLSISGGH
jgi:hypothetical protein